MDWLKQTTLYEISLWIDIFFDQLQKLFLFYLVSLHNFLTFTFENFKEVKILKRKKLINSIFDILYLDGIHLNGHLSIDPNINLNLFKSL